MSSLHTLDAVTINEFSHFCNYLSRIHFVPLSHTRAHCNNPSAKRNEVNIAWRQWCKRRTHPLDYSLCRLFETASMHLQNRTFTVVVAPLNISHHTLPHRLLLLLCTKMKANERIRFSLSASKFALSLIGRMLVAMVKRWRRCYEVVQKAEVSSAMSGFAHFINYKSCNRHMYKAITHIRRYNQQQQQQQQNRRWRNEHGATEVDSPSSSNVTIHWRYRHCHCRPCIFVHCLLSRAFLFIRIPFFLAFYSFHSLFFVFFCEISRHFNLLWTVWWRKGWGAIAEVIRQVSLCYCFQCWACRIDKMIIDIRYSGDHVLWLMHV